MGAYYPRCWPNGCTYLLYFELGVMMNFLDLRTRFFFFSTILIAAIIPFAPDDLKFVPVYTAYFYIFLTVLCALDGYYRHKD